MPTINTSDGDFNADVLSAEKPVLVDFWAEWCGPCKMISPALEEIADQIGKTVRGVKTMLTRRGLQCADYNGAARKEIG